VDVPDVSGENQWFNACPTEDRSVINNLVYIDLDNLDYHWRNDALNVYIVGRECLSAQAGDIPGAPLTHTNIIMLHQNSQNSQLLHEVGHILNLIHTFEPDNDQLNDECNDTIKDIKDGTRDDIALLNFGVKDANLTPIQKAQVDLVWFNVMSYHHPPNTKALLSPCQMDRMSCQADDDYWLLARSPVYVNVTNPSNCPLPPPSDGRAWLTMPDGSWRFPFASIQHAINRFARLRVLVLLQGTHAHPVSTLGHPMDIFTRSGPSRIEETQAPFVLPSNLEESSNVAVRKAMVRAQESDHRGDIAGVIANLQQAEQYATGREKSAIQLELARRFMDSKQYKQAATYFRKTAESADQEGLREYALAHAEAADEETVAEPIHPEKMGAKRGKKTK
jgi:hypothetical protein